jgi:hypothetical protein
MHACIALKCAVTAAAAGVVCTGAFCFVELLLLEPLLSVLAELHV